MRMWLMVLLWIFVLLLMLSRRLVAHLGVISDEGSVQENKDFVIMTVLGVVRII